jgi:hypothetical protein
MINILFPRHLGYVVAWSDYLPLKVAGKIWLDVALMANAAFSTHFGNSNQRNAFFQEFRERINDKTN